MNRRAALLFLALGVSWGIPYLMIKVAVTELPPVTVVAGRTALAALVLLPLALARGAVVPVLRRWRPMAAYTVIEIVVPWLFLTRAERDLPSSTTGLLISAVPVAGVVIAVLGARFTGEPGERLGLGGLSGIALGMAGVGLLVGFDVSGSSLPAVAEMGLVVVGYAIGPVILARYLSDLPGVGVVAVSVAGAALLYVPAMLIGPGLPAQVPSTGALLSVAGLALICTALAFVLLFALVNEIGPLRVTAITYVNPAVAIVAGALVLDERITAVTIVGFAAVLAGSYLVTRRPAPAENPAGAPAEAAVVPGAPVVPESLARA